MDKYIYGIDFGTTNSAISILDIDNKKIIKTFTEPSVLFFTKYPGRNIVHIATGELAINAYLINGLNGRFMKSIKKVLPRTSFTVTNVYDKKYSAPDLVALILKTLKDKADRFINRDIDKAIIGRPVFFDTNESKDSLAQVRLKQAALRAGLNSVSFQMEPIAAAYSYEHLLDKDEIVLIVDIGGGTSDFTIMRLGPGKIKKPSRKDDIIAKGGIYIGGDNFDSAFMWQEVTPQLGRGLDYQSYPGKKLSVPLVLFDNITGWDKISFYNKDKVLSEIDKYYVFTKKDNKLSNLKTVIEDNLCYSIYNEIERTKICLSKNNLCCFDFSHPKFSLRAEVTIERYNTIINPLIEKIGNYIDFFLKEYNVAVTEIDSVFITGGSSQVRAIQNLVSSKFGQDKIRSGDYLNSVSNGLAWSHYTIIEE